MTSNALLQNAFLKPEMMPEDSVKEKKSKRQSTVYDAVAGRISAAGFIPKHTITASTRDTASSSTTSAPPETVLFRRKNAPIRYEESDIYFANERLSKIHLPDSDLLKEVHCYTSEFYSRATADGGVGDWRSMDETALVAFGILLEEASRETLGQTGDLVFTEGEALEDTACNKTPGVGLRARTKSVVSKTEAAVKSGITRSAKRRRLLLGDNNDESNND